MIRGGIGDGALQIGTADGVGTIEHYDLLTRLRSGLKKIAERALVGVEAHANVLNVVDDYVRSGELLLCRTPLRVRIAVYAEDGNAGGRIGRITNLGCVERTPATPCSGLKIAAS